MLSGFFRNRCFSQAAFVAAAGQLFSWKALARRALALFAAMALVMWFGLVSLEVFDLPLMVAVAAGASYLTSISWLKSESVHDMLLLPFSEQHLVWAVCATGLLFVVAGDVVPLSLMLFVSGTAPALECAALAAAGAIASAAVFASATILRRHAQVMAAVFATAGLAFALCLPFQLVFPLLTSLFIAAVALGGKMPDTDSKRSRSARGRTRLGLPANYYAVHMLAEPKAWFSAAGLLVLGTLLSAALIGRGFVAPFNAVCAVSIPPFATFLSRDKDTYLQMELLNTRRSAFAQYFVVLFAASLIVTLVGDVGLALMGAIGIPYVLAGVAICAFGSSISVFLEMRYPLLEWKTEREVYLHPRKYLVMIASLALASLFFLLP